MNRFPGLFDAVMKLLNIDLAMGQAAILDDRSQMGSTSKVNQFSIPSRVLRQVMGMNHGMAVFYHLFLISSMCQSVASSYGHEPWYGRLLSPVSDLIDVSECDKKEEETFGNIMITYLNLEHSCLNAFARCILPRSWGWGPSGPSKRENMCQWYSAAVVLSASGPVVFSNICFCF